MASVRRTWIAGVVAAAALAAASCGGGGATPAVPGSPTVAAPDPAPAPASGGESASANSCPIGKGSPDAACAKGSPQLLAAVESAIDRLVRDRPELFNLQEESVAGTGQYRVLDKEAYVDGVLANLRAAGMCAGRSLDLELVQVKSTNAYSEDFDIWTSSGFVRRGGGRLPADLHAGGLPARGARHHLLRARGPLGLRLQPRRHAPAPAGGPGAARLRRLRDRDPEAEERAGRALLGPRLRHPLGAARGPRRGLGRARLRPIRTPSTGSSTPRARWASCTCARPCRASRVASTGRPSRRLRASSRPAGRAPEPRWTRSTAAR